MSSLTLRMAVQDAVDNCKRFANTPYEDRLWWCHRHPFRFVAYTLFYWELVPWIWTTLL